MWFVVVCSFRESESESSGDCGLNSADMTDDDCVRIGLSERYANSGYKSRIARDAMLKVVRLAIKLEPCFLISSVLHDLQAQLPAMAAGQSSAVHGNANDEHLRQRKPLNEPAGSYVTEHGREMDKKLEQHEQ